MAAKVKLSIDLQYVIRNTFSDKRVRDKARQASLSPSFKREYGRRIIDEIIRRTREDNKDKSGKQFVKYSKSYKESLVFDIYGKSNEVDLTLTGEMLSSMEVMAIRPMSIEIGFISQTQNDKAHGHINGTRSKKGKRQLPVRDFFGVSTKKQSEIFKETLREFNEGATFILPEEQTVSASIGEQEIEL